MKPFTKSLLVASVVAGVLMFVGLLLLGIPGAILLEIPTWLGVAKGIEGDGAWPAAILVTLVWPMFIPLGVIARHLLSTRGFTTLAKVALWGTIVGGTVLVVTLVHLAA
jgi:hypothetical protein